MACPVFSSLIGQEFSAVLRLRELVTLKEEDEWVSSLAVVQLS
jgi:hypothetical protein